MTAEICKIAASFLIDLLIEVLKQVLDVVFIAFMLVDNVIGFFDNLEEFADF